MSDNKEPVRCPMVGWYDPGQLARTAVDVAVSTIFGRNADYRVTEALVTPAAEDAVFGDEAGAPPNSDGVYDYDHGDGKEMWLDFIADSGDGWNSTYSVAYHVSQPQLQPAGAGEPLPRGRVLVFGGDEVYPTSSRQVYRERLVQPFAAASPRTDSPNPDVFAVPGNHDWYDSLVSFTRLFCSRRAFGNWNTRQARSYFALKLPQHWWLIGTDVQLASDIDVAQVRYFKHVASLMEPQDRIILCTAEPHWIYAKIYNKFDKEINENNLAFLEQRVFGREISVYLSGDLHHYRRHATDAGLQKITAGGGGAFLHPTHGPDVTELADGYKLKKAFPSSGDSWKINLKNLGFLFMNPKFGVVTALLYTLTCWSVMADLSKYKSINDTWLAMGEAVSRSITNPTAVFWILLVWGGFLMFTDVHSKPYRIIAGTLHGLAHVLAVFFIGWFATYVSVKLSLAWFDKGFMTPHQLLIAAVIIFGLGWIVGSIVMGVYLLISLNIFKRHANEAFSALACPDWKNFLRLRIDPNGRLTIFPIGIRRVARKWKASGSTTGSAFLPDDSNATPPELIEAPITI
jgi:hypothetical protein